jgi:hypothetical protein
VLKSHSVVSGFLGRGDVVGWLFVEFSLDVFKHSLEHLFADVV